MDMLALTLRQGSVYYMQDRRLTSPEPHFFIVLNHAPLADRVLLLAVSTSQVEALKLRRRTAPPESVVELSPAAYAEFAKPSAVDCNAIFEMSVAELRERLRARLAGARQDLPQVAVQALVRGVLASPLVVPSHKALLRPRGVCGRQGRDPGSA
jgi:hypothetical protein